MKRKTTAALTALLMAATTLTPQLGTLTLDAAETLPGDVNLDAAVDVKDIWHFQRHLLRSESLTAEQAANADQNGDGFVNVIDLTIQKQSLLKQIALAEFDGLMINEVCSSNKSLQDAAGASPDWIELYNASDKEISLDGIGVSDGAKNKFKFAFPEETVMPADSYILIYCDDAVNQAEGEYHAAFKVSATGETIYLTHPEYGELDSVAVPELDTDVAYGRYRNGSGSFTYLSTTPGKTNDTATDLQIVEKPVFSVEGGFYDEQFMLALSDNNGNEIYYTTDGSDPRTSETAQVYDGEINIYNNTSDPNVYSALRDITLDNYTPTTEKVDKGIIIRAVSQNANGTYSAVATNSYFVGKTASYYKDMKVLSLATDSDYLFDEDTGAYMVGSGYYEWKNSPDYIEYEWWNDVNQPTNYNKQGRETEFPVTVQVFEEGKLAYTADVGARIAGNWTRGYPQKSIRLYARSEYGDSKMKYAFIDGLTDINGNLIESFDKLTIRNAGTDNQNLHFRDVLMQDLVSDRGLDGQAAEPCILFIEGEFWGFYFLREKLDNEYIASHYGIDKDDVTLLKNNDFEEGSETIAAEYKSFCEWAATADMTVAENYQKVCDTIDVQNFMDYIAIQTYINNSDWAIGYMNNWQMWRSNTIDPNIEKADGKWRFVLYDLENCAAWFKSKTNTHTYDSLNNLCMDDTDYNFVPMFYNLINNDTFREQFYNNYLEIIETNYDPDLVDAKITEYVTAYESITRITNMRFNTLWVNNNYNNQLSLMREFFQNRPAYAKLYLDNLVAKYETSVSENLLPDVSEWNQYGTADYGAEFSTDSTNQIFQVITTMVTPNAWDVQTKAKNVTLEQGKTYQLTFQASCSSNVGLFVSIGRKVDSTNYLTTWKTTAALTPELQEFTYTFIMEGETNTDWYLQTQFGSCIGEYVIQNATLCEVVSQ